MPAFTFSFVKRDDASEIDKGTTYIVLGIVFGALALVCLLVTVYLLARLRRADRKLDRELAATVYNNDFAPQFKEKGSFEHEAEHEYHYQRPQPTGNSMHSNHSNHSNTNAPYLPSEILALPRTPSPAPMRPMRRPSSLFDRRRISNTPKPPTPRMNDSAFAQQQQQRRVPVPAEPEPVARPEEMRLPTLDDTRDSFITRGDTESVYTVATARPGFGRSPSLLRKILHERVAAAAPPVPALPAEHQTLPPPTRGMTTLSTAIPYELESAAPGPTPVDVPPETAVIDVYDSYRYSRATMTTEPESASRLTLLRPPMPVAAPPPVPPLQPRRSPPPQAPQQRPAPPALTLHIPNPNTAGTTRGPPPPPAAPKPQYPASNPLADFAARLRPETTDFANEPTIVHDTDDFRITMRPTHRR